MVDTLAKLRHLIEYDIDVPSKHVHITIKKLYIQKMRDVILLIMLLIDLHIYGEAKNMLLPQSRLHTIIT